MKSKTLGYCERRILLDDYGPFFFILVERGCERMGGNKTLDGLPLSKILSFVESIGVDVRSGNNHPYVLNYNGMRPCPVASSTNAKRMIVPWIRAITGDKSSEVYKGLRNGKLR